MGKRIRLVTPVISDGFLRRTELFQPVAGWQTEISQVQIERGPASIESEFDEALAVPDTVAKIIEAERDGVDAVVIDCMGDPGMQAAREAVSIPVLGPGEATMHIASMLGHRFSIVTVLSSCIPLMENQAKVYGVAGKLASVRSVDHRIEIRCHSRLRGSHHHGVPPNPEAPADEPMSSPRLSETDATA